MGGSVVENSLVLYTTTSLIGGTTSSDSDQARMEPGRGSER